MNPLAFTYLGTPIYHTRKDDARWSRLLVYWFSFSAEAFGEGESFDVRVLRAAGQVPETGSGRGWAEAVIRFALESGELAVSAIKQK